LYSPPASACFTPLLQTTIEISPIIGTVSMDKIENRFDCMKGFAQQRCKLIQHARLGADELVLGAWQIFANSSLSVSVSGGAWPRSSTFGTKDVPEGLNPNGDSFRTASAVATSRAAELLSPAPSGCCCESPR